MSKIHHYTSIDTLELILKNNTLRLNRLDRVDDRQEAELFQKLNISECFFVSSWTHHDTESIPMWDMYTNNKGVMISLPPHMFNYDVVQFPKKYEKYVRGEMKSIIPYEDMYDDEYFIMPIHQSFDKFMLQVDYKSQVDVHEEKNEAISVESTSDGNVKIQIKEAYKLAAIKSDDWSFQEETRFILFILPGIKIPPQGPLSEEYGVAMANHAVASLLEGNGPSIEYYDIDLNKDVLDKIEVTIGPLCTKKEIKRVKNIVDKNTKNGKVKQSKFKGQIRSRH